MKRLVVCNLPCFWRENLKACTAGIHVFGITRCILQNIMVFLLSDWLFSLCMG